MKEGTLVLTVGPLLSDRTKRVVVRAWRGDGRRLRAYRPVGWRERWRRFPVNFNMLAGPHSEMLRGRPFRLVGLEAHMARAWFAEGVVPWLLHWSFWKARAAYYVVLQQMALDGFLALREGEWLTLRALCLPMLNPYLESEQALRERLWRIREAVAASERRSREQDLFWARVARFRAEGLLP